MKSLVRNSIILFFLLTAISAEATHIVGGELNYRYLGEDLYEVKLTVYRDCHNGIPDFDNPAFLFVFDGTNNPVTRINLQFPGKDTLPLSINSPCYSPPLDICYEGTEYLDTISLPPVAGGYQLVYQRCCRNETIVNIPNPGSRGATYYASIPDTSVVNSNSNPYFKNWPIPFLCVGVPFEFNHSAIDPEGDSLTYSFCTPLSGGSAANSRPNPASSPPYNEMSWLQGYSKDTMMTGYDPLMIDPETGELTVTPDKVGQYVLGVCVQEYRDGVLISETRRDFQFNVVDCPVIEVDASFDINCRTNTVDFINNSTGAISWLWDFGVDSIQTDTSSMENPQYIYGGSGEFTTMLVASAEMDTNCKDTFYFNINTLPYFEVMTEDDILICQGDSVQVQTTFPGNTEASFSWTPTEGLNDPDLSEPMASPEQTTTYYLSAFNENCSYNDSVTVNVSDEYPKAEFDSGWYFDCEEGLEVLLIDRSLSFNTLEWYLSNGDTAYSEEVSYKTDKLPAEVTLIAKGDVCTDTVSKIIDDDFYDHIFNKLPNVFTPNNDGHNDQFCLDKELQRLSECYELNILNRWGENIFKSEDPEECWDGKIRNTTENAAEDVYYYTMKIRDNVFTGYIKIIR